MGMDWIREDEISWRILRSEMGRMVRRCEGMEVGGER